MNRVFLPYFKGFLIGLGMLIPGLSGGTMAVLLNTFEDILEAVSGFFRHITASIKTLFPIAAGAAIGVMLCAKPIEFFCVSFPTLSKYIFCSISIIGCLFFAKQKIGLDAALKQIPMIILGALTAFVITLVIEIYHLNLSDAGFIILFLVGILLSLALILPAISFSYMLLFFGIYENTLNAISDFRFDYLFPLGIGIILGSYIFAKLLLKLLNTHTTQTYCFVLGFVIMSVADILC